MEQKRIYQTKEELWEAHRRLTSKEEFEVKNNHLSKKSAKNKMRRYERLKENHLKVAHKKL